MLGLGDVDASALGRNLGKPYTDIPDPFGETASYGAHFTDLLARSADAVGVDVEMVSNTELYESGKFEAVTREVLEKRDLAREVLAEYQDGVDESYVPFMPQCSECGKLTQDVRGVDLDVGTVDYRCSGLDAGGALRSLGLATVLPLTQFLAWVVFTVAIYYDMKYVRHHVPDWPLNGTLYIAAAIVLPVFTQVFGAAALFVGGTVGLAVAAVVPAVLLGLAVRHTRTRNRLVTSA